MLCIAEKKIDNNQNISMKTLLIQLRKSKEKIKKY